MSPMSAVHALWQSALLAGGVWLMMRVVTGASAESRYWLWSATLAVIAVLPLFALLPRVEVMSALPFPTTVPAVPTTDSMLLEPVAVPHSSALTAAGQIAVPLLMVLWAVIASWRLLALASAALTLRRWRGAAQRVAISTLPLPPAVLVGCDVRESTDVMTPVVVGILNPCILLPQGLRARLSHSQLALVLLHELAHVRRRDGWCALVQRLIEAAYFYNPVVHWVSAQIERERESSCDDRAIRATNESGLSYAECLVHVSREVATAQIPSLAVGALGDPSQLAHRVRRLIDRPEATDTRVSSRSVALGISVVVCAALAMSLVVPSAVAREVRESPHHGNGTPLLEAARRGDLALVQSLIERGADVNEPVLRDGNPLIVAAANGHLDVVMTLVEHGADVNAFVPEDETPLINAARNGQSRVVTYLIDKGADVNLAVLANGNEMRSPLGEARKHGHQDLTDLLLQRGAKP